AIFQPSRPQPGHAPCAQTQLNGPDKHPGPPSTPFPADLTLHEKLTYRNQIRKATRLKRY
ncbi:MAG: hypothetical protein PVJ22_21025, partial [Desulfobacterales bacterium]